jgi:hypothetical protein
MIYSMRADEVVIGQFSNTRMSNYKSIPTYATAIQRRGPVRAVYST